MKDTANIQHQECGSRMFWQFFFIFFRWDTDWVILVIWSFGQNRFLFVKIRHYNKYFIFIYSEQMTESENENDHFDLDHFDHVFSLTLDKRLRLVIKNKRFILFLLSIFRIFAKFF